jgi:hypothetical protein
VRFNNQLVARGTYMPRLPDLLQDLSQVVRLGTLQRRKYDIRLEFLQPQELSDGQQIPVVNMSRNRTSKCSGYAKQGARIPPSQVVSLPRRKGVTPPSG